MDVLAEANHHDLPGRDAVHPGQGLGSCTLLLTV